MAENMQDVFWIATPTIDRVIYASPAYEKSGDGAVKSSISIPQHLMESIHPEVGTGLFTHCCGQGARHSL